MFKKKVCPEDLIFGDLNDQLIPSTYSDLTNDYDIYGTQIDADLTYNEGLEDSVVPNDKKNDEEILDSDIDPPKNIMETEGVDRMGNETKERKIEGVGLKLKEWTQTMKEWKTKY